MSCESGAGWSRRVGMGHRQSEVIEDADDWREMGARTGAEAVVRARQVLWSRRRPYI
jgi:hypothetical protein